MGSGWLSNRRPASRGNIVGGLGVPVFTVGSVRGGDRPQGSGGAPQMQSIAWRRPGMFAGAPRKYGARCGYATGARARRTATASARRPYGFARTSAGRERNGAVWEGARGEPVVGT